MDELDEPAPEPDRSETGIANREVWAHRDAAFSALSSAEASLARTQCQLNQLYALCSAHKEDTDYFTKYDFKKHWFAIHEAQLDLGLLCKEFRAVPRGRPVKVVDTQECVDHERKEKNIEALRSILTKATPLKTALAKLEREIQDDLRAPDLCTPHGIELSEVINFRICYYEYVPRLS